MNTTQSKMRVDLLNKEFRKLVPKLREKGFYKCKEKRKISWPEYNLAQIYEAVVMMRKMKKLVNLYAISPCKSVGRPPANPKDLAKAILVAELLGSPERQSQGWLEMLGPFLGINSILDDRVIGRGYNRFEVLQILKEVFEKTKTSDGSLMGDGTGIETSRKQNYEANKKKTDNYLVSIIDSREIVQAFEMSNKECKTMHSLIKEVDGNSLRLDAGFIDKELIREIVELGMKSFVFPKKSLNLNGDTYWKSMFLELFHETQKWLCEYHQRSHCESFHSSFKRKNRILMKINPLSKLIQLTARIIIHNLRKQNYYSRLKD